MKVLLNKVNIKKWLDKTGKVLLRIIALTLFLIVLIIPFVQINGRWFEAFKWAWIVSIVLNLYLFSNYKKAREQKIFIPIFSFFATLTLFYLCNYWNLVPMCVAIVCSIVIGLLEFGITVKLYRTVRFTEKQELKFLPSKATDSILLGSVYASSIALFILGHYLNKTMVFIFGIIAMIMLFSSVISVVSKGFKASNSILSTICVILDIVSVLALIGYLIYLTPNDDGLQDIVLSLTSAVIGGALTLAGVAWTIKKTDDDKKEETISHAIPYLQINNYKRNEVQCSRVIIVEEEAGREYNVLFVSNIGLELCFIKYVKSNDAFIPVENAYISAGDTLRLDLKLKSSKLQGLVVCDRMSNYYILELSGVGERFPSIGLPEKIDIRTVGIQK